MVNYTWSIIRTAGGVSPCGSAAEEEGYLEPEKKEETAEAEKTARAGKTEKAGSDFDFRNVVIVILAVIIAAGGIVLTVRTLKEKELPVRPAGIGLTIDPDAGDYVPVTGEAQEAAQGVSIPGWASLTLPANTVNAKYCVDFYNPEANAGRYYLTFELRLPDDSPEGYEVLYTSKLVEPGKHIQSIQLERKLQAGKYRAVVHVQPYKMDGSMTPTNNADMETELIVK